MTSIVQVTAHPVPGLQCEVHIQDYKGEAITAEEFKVIPNGTVAEFAVYDGRKLTICEVAAPEPDKPKEDTPDKEEVA